MTIFRAETVSTEPFTPGMIRVTLGGDGLASFDSSGVGDEYLRVFFPSSNDTEPRLPFATDDGWEYPAGVDPGPMRTFTVRAHRPERGELTIDVNVHGHGVACEWAERARPGDVVGVNSPRGLYDPPADLEWQILLADGTGLPAAGRLIESAPGNVRTRAVLEVAGAAHRLLIDAPPNAEIVWIRGGNGRAPSRLEAILRSLELPVGRGYVWAAGETRVLRGIRRYLRHELGLPGTAYKVVSYWTDRAEAWQERYEGLDAETRAALDGLWDSDRDEEEIEDEYIHRLEQLGL